MCGIVGYVGNHSSKQPLLLGLKQLEYRGYDSCGVATFQGDQLVIKKSINRIDDLIQITKEMEFSNVGIGHTRWATHGVPNEINAHPHVDAKRQYALVHNGIIENDVELKKKLMQHGVMFQTQTDTEVIVNLISFYTESEGSPLGAIHKAMQELKGSFAIAVLEVHHPDTMYVARRKSPLLIGKQADQTIVASDFSAISEYTNEVYLLENDEMAEIRQDQILFYDANLKPVTKETTKMEMAGQDLQLGNYQHYMQKEIFETPIAVRRTLEAYCNSNREIDLGLPKEVWQGIAGVTIVACGTAMHAGLTAKYTMEEMLGIPVQVEVASEYKYRRCLLGEKDLVIFISQSGETADTIAVQEMIKTQGIRHIAIVNVPNSTLARTSDYVLYTKAGVEVAVASTKAYIAQVTLLLMVALEMAREKGAMEEAEEKQFVEELFAIPTDMETVLEDAPLDEAYAKEIVDQRSMFFLGRGMDYYAVMEGSLKLKEISYIHSEAYQAGELKHGTIALIEPGTKVVAVCTNPSLLEKMRNNVKEVIARGAHVLWITNCDAIQETEAEKVLSIPKTNGYLSPLLSVIPMQLIAYYTTVQKGLDVDKPRNLAKSVTVE